MSYAIVGPFQPSAGASESEKILVGSYPAAFHPVALHHSGSVCTHLEKMGPALGDYL